MRLFYKSILFYDKLEYFYYTHRNYIVLHNKPVYYKMKIWPPSVLSFIQNSVHIIGK
jgi:hypothetical protein